MRHLLERPGGTQPQTPLPRLRPTQITELLKILDPGHTGVIQLASLEKINPSITSSPSPVNPAEPLDETEDTAVCLYIHLLVCVCVCAHSLQELHISM